MKVSDILTESPLPDDWDKKMFNPNKVSFARRREYIMKRVNTIGEGSSRIAAEIEYEGRPTVLKVAKSHTGIAQNIFESKKLSDPNVTKHNISIPMIDYDTDNNYSPIWIHVEYADRMTLTRFKEFFSGFSPIQLIENIKTGIGEERTKVEFNDDDTKMFKKSIVDNESIRNLISLLMQNKDINFNELRSLTNWGIYQNHPVIIDLGGI